MLEKMNEPKLSPLGKTPCTMGEELRGDFEPTPGVEEPSLSGMMG